MTTMGIEDSGNLAAEKSNFSKTCSLLSQHLKEKRNFGDLSLGFTQKFESGGNLLPIKEESGETFMAAGLEKAVTKSDMSGNSGAETGQMTIFYAGEVLVFDDFSADKVKEIMALATRISSIHNHRSPAFAPPFTAQSPAESGTNIPKTAPSFGIQDRTHHTPHSPLCSDLPGARKSSLARFLQKRKDRIKEKAPYEAMKPVSADNRPSEGGQVWLGLGP